MRKKKSIIVIISSVVLIITLLVMYPIIKIISVTLMMLPSLEYTIKSSKGYYPTVKELGDAFWIYNDSEIDIELITIDGKIFGEITTQERTFPIKGKFLYSDMYLYCTHQENPQDVNWVYPEHTIVETYYEYVDGKIMCSNVKTDSKHLAFSKDFTLTKKKNIDKNLFEEWRCEELNFQLITYAEIEEYSLVKLVGKNKPFQLTKIYDNYYELLFTSVDYSVYGCLEKQDKKIVFNIIYTNINENRIDEKYIPDDIKTLTFVKV
jgi:hypothetical protein